LWKGREHTPPPAVRPLSIRPQPVVPLPVVGRPVDVDPEMPAETVSSCGGEAGSSPRGTGLTEREHLIDAMEKAGWVQAKAARILGLTPRQIGYALKKHDVEIKRF
jgi:Nif-specific regulatory protein